MLSLLREDGRRRISAVLVGLGVSLVLVGAITYEPPQSCILLAGVDCPENSPLPGLAIWIGSAIIVLGTAIFALGHLMRR
jgi:hypothetical protein